MRLGSVIPEGLVIRSSSIHAAGCYTTKAIKKGRRVCEYDGPRFTKDEADERYKDRDVTYLFSCGDSKMVIDGFGIAMFINHCCDPNCETEEVDGRVYVSAVRDIKAGEELTYEYHLHDSDDAEGDCYCGASKCRGTMFSEDEVKRRARKAKRDAAKAAAKESKNKAALVVCLFLLVTLSGFARAQQAGSERPERTSSGYYYDTHQLDLKLLVPQPPAVDSAANSAELVELHSIEKNRTPEQAARAKEDEANESMFAFSTVLGAGFTAKALPITAELGEHVKHEQGVAGGALKGYFQRPRPYQTDPTLHPVCGVKTAHDSYPSGHGLTGYLEAFTLVQLFPEKRVEILARADDYAHNRLVCGVHYPSDEEASLRVANAVFGNMLANPKFQHDLEAAREELKVKGIAAK